MRQQPRARHEVGHAAVGTRYFLVEAVEPCHVKIAENIDVVYQNGIARVEEVLRLAQAAARVEQGAGLVAHLNVEPKVVVLVKEVDNLA